MIAGHAVVVRSPHAHARFRIAGIAQAKAMPGVRAILTGADTSELGLMPCVVGVPGQKMVVPPCPVLALDEVHHVGDAVAFVVADTLDQARDAAEALAIDWDALPHVIGAERALADDAPLVWLDRPGNLAFEVTFGDRAKTEAAFAKAAHVARIKLVNQRLVTNYIDTRGVIAEYESGRDHYTLTLGSQGSHAIRDVIGVGVMGLAPEQMRVITPDVGGGFGTKLFAYREYALAAVAAKLTGRPVKWVADRTEHFLGDTHGRDNITTARLALDADGRFLALDVDTIADMGAYLSTYAPYIPYIGAAMLPGRLRHRGLLRAGARGLYQHRACRCLSRRGAAGSVLCDRAAGRCGSARIGVAPDTIRPPKFHFTGADAVRYRDRQDL